MARAPKQSTQIKIPQAIKANSQPEPELADNTNELSDEERELAEQSLEDDDFSPDGGASIGDVDPENEDQPAYEGAADESEVVSEEEDSTLDGQEEDSSELDDQEDQDSSEESDPDESDDSDEETFDESSAQVQELQPEAPPIRSGRPMKRQLGHPIQTTEKQLTNRVAILQDGDIMEGTDSHVTSAQLPAEQLPDANECLAWIDMNNLTANQQQNRTWVVRDSGDNIIGAGHSLPIACHAAGMRAVTGATEVDDDVNNP